MKIFPLEVHQQSLQEKTKKQKGNGGQNMS
jgi:hypothetical protein